MNKQTNKKINMNAFPLYENLIKNTKKKDLTIKQKEYFISKINNIDDEGKKMVYVLVYIYKINNNDDLNDGEEIPYRGVKENVGELENISWNFNNFPNKLKQMLHNFCILNENKKIM
jgi:hypothetical protein